MPQTGAKVDEGKAPQRSALRRWLPVLAIIGFFTSSYVAAYMVLCDRYVTRAKGRVMPVAWMDRGLAVVAPPHTAYLFFPAICGEAFVRGCWAEVRVADRTVQLFFSVYPHWQLSSL